MDSPLFSSLVYQIIGDPQKWQNTSLGMLDILSDERVAKNIDENAIDASIAHDIIDRLSDHNEVLSAFSTFLESNRYGIVILDNDYHHIYYNSKANAYVSSICCPRNNKQISVVLVEQIRQAITDDTSSSLIPLKFEDRTFYLRKTTNNSQISNEEKTFYVLILPVDNDERIDLHPELKSRYGLTKKEEVILVEVIEGKSIKNIANDNHVSQNTVKSHIKSIFQKTDTNSQTALTSLFLSHEMQILESYFDFKMPESIIATSHHSAEDKFISLTNGLTLCYREYGPKDGKPILVMHNNYSCRLSVPHNYEAICKKHNRRIIIPDRPGVGRSDYYKNYPKKWNDYLREFIDSLGLESFSLLGNNFGASYAISYACSDDQRIDRLLLTSPVFLNTKQDKIALGSYLRPGARLVSVSKRIAAEVYTVWTKSMLLNVEKHFNDMHVNNLGKEEKVVFDNDPAYFRTITHGFSEAYRYSNKGGVADLVFTLTPLKQDLSKLNIPIEIWAGDAADNLVNFSGLREVCNNFNGAQFHARPGYGNELYYVLFEEIISS